MRNIYVVVLVCFCALFFASLCAAAKEKIVPIQPGGISLRADTGLAIPVTKPQSERFGLGGAETIKVFYGLNRYLDVGPSATFMGLSGSEFGSAWAFGGSVQLKRPHDIEGNNPVFLPWVDADSLYVRTGQLNRFGFAVGAGVLIPVVSDRSISIGPFARYLHIVQAPDRKGYDNRDSQNIILGVSAELSPRIWREVPFRPTIPPPVIELPVGEPPIVVLPVVEPPIEEPVVPPVDLQIEEMIQFKWNSAVLEGNQSSVLDEVVQLLKDNPDYSVTLAGHTSSEGNERHNQDLSVRRATAVRDYLTARGIEKERLEILGLASTEPIGTNETQAGRVANRRVEFEVYPTIDVGGE